MSAPPSALLQLEVTADSCEDRVNLWAKQDERGDNHNGHQRDDERLLNESLTATKQKHAILHNTSSTTTYSTASIVSGRRRNALLYTSEFLGVPTPASEYNATISLAFDFA